MRSKVKIDSDIKGNGSGSELEDGSALIIRDNSGSDGATGAIV